MLTTMLTMLMPLFIKNIGVPGFIVIVVLVLIFFGGKKIPELMRGMGRGIKEFKEAVTKDYSSEKVEDVEEEMEVEELPKKTKKKTAKSKSAAKPAGKKTADKSSVAASSAGTVKKQPSKPRPKSAGK